MKLTAVEWLVNQLIFKQEYEHLPNNYFLMGDKDIDAIIQKAKEMEKQQIIDAFYQCGRDNFEYIIAINRSATEYYNETYGSKGSDELGQSLEWNGEVTQGSDDQVPDVRKMVDKDEQKSILVELMELDSKDGLYHASSQTEISDEEIEKASENAWSDYEYEEGNLYSTTFIGGWKLAIKWYREQLKSRQ